MKVHRDRGANQPACSTPAATELTDDPELVTCRRCARLSEGDVLLGRLGAAIVASSMPPR